MEVAQDLVLEAPRALLIRAGQIEAARVAAQAFLVVVVVVVQGRRLCNQTTVRGMPDEGVTCFRSGEAERQAVKLPLGFGDLHLEIVWIIQAKGKCYFLDRD